MTKQVESTCLFDKKNGGGNRFVEYLPSNLLTLEDILNRASKLYFPGGKNKFAGQLG